MSTVVRLLAWLLALAVVSLPLAALLNGWMTPERWPLRHLDVTAEYQRVSENQIASAIADHVGLGYFDTSPIELRAAVAALPWVQHVEVRKRWPDRVEVLLVEHHARARWGQDQLLSEQGALFSAPVTPDLQALPQLAGPDDRTAEVLAFYEGAKQQLHDSGLEPVGARLSQRGSWSLQLLGGASIEIGRNANPQERLARLVRALPQVLAGEQRALTRIDLRYTTGFAVLWAAPAAEAAADGTAG